MAGPNGAGAMQIKSEPGSQGLSVKPEPQSPGAASAFDDDDLYEDAGDLDFSKASQAVWLMRLPKYVWENWSQLKDDDEIQLGTVRVEPRADGGQDLSLLLSAQQEVNKGLPREYNMAITNASTTNTFIFTEQDLPGHGFKGKAGVRNPKLQNDRRTWDRPRYQPYIRKPIPKHTALVGAVKHEVNCLPTENAEFTRIMAERNREAMKPRAKTVVIPINALKEDLNLLAPGTIGNAHAMDSFIVRLAVVSREMRTSLTIDRKLQAREQRKQRKTTRLLACLATSCSMQSSLVSVNTTTGLSSR